MVTPKIQTYKKKYLMVAVSVAKYFLLLQSPVKLNIGATSNLTKHIID